MPRGWYFAVPALVLLSVALVGLIATTPAGAALLMWGLEQQSYPPDPQQLSDVDAIVVLGGRTARIHTAARLHMASGIPLLLTGKGTGDSGFEAESERMEDILLRRYGVGPRWVETESRSTRENAEFSWCLVSGMGVRNVALVTDAYHMPRARAEFQAAGFREVTAATADPVLIRWRPHFTWSVASFMPGLEGWKAARRPLREWGGTIAATLRWAWRPSPSCPGDQERHGPQ